MYSVTIVLISLALLHDHVSTQETSCPGLPVEESDGVVCCLEAPTNCSNNFSPKTIIRYRCRDLYVPAQYDHDFDGSNTWYESVCQQNGKWSGFPDFKYFRCRIDFGLWRKNYHSIDSSNKISVPLILSATRVDPIQTPWNAAIFTGFPSSFVCGGTLIEALPLQFILTAAHCLFHDPTSDLEMRSEHELRVVLGAQSGMYESAVNKEISPDAQIYSVTKVAVHDQYHAQENNYSADIAILMLDHKVPINEHVMPVALPKESQSHSLDTLQLTLEIVGYGISDDHDHVDRPSQLLYGVNVTTNPHSCTGQPFDSELKICATPIVSTSDNKDSAICEGDSGHAAFLWDGILGAERRFIQGIVSIGIEDRSKTLIEPPRCFSVSILTKVYPFVKWIKEQINDMKPRPNLPPATTPTQVPTTTTTTISTTKPTTTTSKPPPTFPDYAITAMNLHNQFRAKHDAPPLILDPQLQQAAQEWATYLAYNNYKPGSNPDSKYGQNYYQTFDTSVTASDLVGQAINFWYADIYNYDPNNPNDAKMWTQLVWKSTKGLGIYIATQGQRSVVIAMYSPPGNIVGQYDSNVDSKNITPRPLPIIPTPTPTFPPITSPTISTDSSPGNDFRQYATNLHNEYRRRHGVAPLLLDDQVSNDAQNYANEITRNNYVLQPQYGSIYGQNVFENDGRVIQPMDAVHQAVQKWYSGINGYNWGYPLGSAPTGLLFSQVVWKTSSRIGVGVSSGLRRTVVIVFYSPPGNVQSVDSYKENVLPPRPY